MTQRCFLIGMSSAKSTNSLRTHYQGLAQALAQRGHRVIVLLDGQRGEADQTSNPIRYDWPSRRPTKPADARFLAKLIRQEKPDCVIGSFGSVNMMMLVGAFMGVKLRVAWYQTLSHQIDIDEVRNPRAVRWLKQRKQWVYRFAHHLVPVSKFAIGDLAQNFGVSPAKCHVFYNSTRDSGLPEPYTQRDGSILCAGRLDTSKGQDVLLRALASLKAEGIEPTVNFVGGGPQAEAFEALAAELGLADQCNFRGLVSPEEVWQLMRSASVSAVPSRSDNCPLVVVESLASGTPLIAGAVGGIPEMFTDGAEGFLVSLDDSDTMAARIKTLLTEPEQTAQMSERARARFMQQFEQVRVANQMADWFESLLAGA